MQSIKYFLFCLFIFAANSSLAQDSDEIQWLDLETAAELNKKHPEKKLFIDFYTSWCGWCKKMDKSTFMDPSIVQRLNKEFIPVKFDAEGKADVVYNDKTYSYVEAGRSGVHAFAYFLLRGQLSYPSYVVLDEKNRKAEVFKGYFSAEDLHIALDGN